MKFLRDYFLEGHYGTRYAVHGTRYTVHGTWYTVDGTRFTVHCTRYTVHGTRYNFIILHLMRKTKELSHVLKFSNPYILSAWWCKPFIFQTQIISSTRIYNFKYLRPTALGWKDIWIKKSEFVAKNKTRYPVTIFKNSSMCFFPITIKKRIKRPNLKNLSRGLNLIRGSNLVGST